MDAIPQGHIKSEPNTDNSLYTTKSTIIPANVHGWIRTYCESRDCCRRIFYIQVESEPVAREVSVKKVQCPCCGKHTAKWVMFKQGDMNRTEGYCKFG